MADLASLYRSLASLHRAGIGWAEALRTAAPAGGGWEAAHARLASGSPLPQAVEGLVPPLDLALLQAADVGGTYERSLAGLAQRHEDEHRARGRRRAALAYPLFVAHVAALLMPFPDLIRGRPLAALGWALAALIPIYLFAWYARRTPTADRPLPDRFPFRPRVMEQDARGLAALGALHDAGVRLPEALPLASAAGEFGRVARDLVRAQGVVADGRPLAEAWRETPSEVRAGLVSAERAGALGAECRAASARLAEDAAHLRQTTLARATPLVMLAVGLVVAARVVSFYADYLAQAGVWR